jgi:hypothetical protein
MNENIPDIIGPAGLKDKHFIGRVLAKPIGKATTRRASPNDDIIVTVFFDDICHKSPALKMYLE